MRRYIALIRQERSSVFSVEFPDLPGCVSAGETMEEAIERAAEVLGFYAAEMVGNGLSLPDPTPSELILGAAEAQGAAAVLVTVGPPRTQLGRLNIPVDERFLKQIDAAAAERGITRSAFLIDAAHRQMRPRRPGADLARAVDALIATGGKPVDVIKEVIARERRPTVRDNLRAQIIRMPDRHGDESLPPMPEAWATMKSLTTIEQEVLRRVLAGEKSPALAESLGIDLPDLEHLLDEALKKIVKRDSR